MFVTIVSQPFLSYIIAYHAQLTYEKSICRERQEMRVVWTRCGQS